MEQVPSYPLHWPQGFPRTAAREKGAFKTEFSSALHNVSSSLRMFGNDSGKAISAVVMSSNMAPAGLASDGSVRSGDKLDDPGVAVWFVWEGMQVCIPVDRYASVASNLQAIHHIIEARRTELRHGTLALVKATFSGFKALPAPAGTHWKEVLALPAGRRVTRELIEEQFKTLAAVRHPDKGGSTDAMAKLNAARGSALKEIGG
jgi:hypothetical protein